MPSRAALRASLRAYTARDCDQRAHLDRMVALLGVPGDPFARDHFAPGHFTASGFVLSPDGGSLLLVRHEKLRRWLQPGGHIDADDADVVAAARRELAEEAGLADLTLEVEGVFDLDIHVIPAFGAEPFHEHFDVRFAFRAPSDELHAGSDAKAARWVPLSEMVGETWDRSLTRAVHRLMQRNCAAQNREG